MILDQSFGIIFPNRKFGFFTAILKLLLQKEKVSQY